MPSGNGPSTVRSLVGVYDADGTLRGEVAYVVGKLLGTTHCALCDITHGPLRERSSWRRCRDGLPVPFATFHRDDQPDEVRHLTGAALPAVVALTGRGPLLLVGPDELDRCGSSPDRLVAAIGSAMERLGLTWGTLAAE